MSRSYPHMCRMDHVEIGHRDSSEERCPLCRAIDDRDAALARAEKAEEAIRLFKLDEQIHHEDMEAIHKLVAPHIEKGADEQNFETTAGMVENAINALRSALALSQQATAEAQSVAVWAVDEADCSTLSANGSRRTLRVETFAGVQVIPTDGTQDGIYRALRQAMGGGDGDRDA